jgi:alpha-tubulin suppressor-like RCC1 family protein
LAIPGLEDVTQISVAITHSCALMADASVRCWGLNKDGQLGDGTREPRDRPTPVVGLTDVVSVAAAIAATCALRRDGSVLCWGDNEYGQLGDGTTTSRDTPTPVAF